ncbi:MAG: hypothetical protein QMC83_02855 [Thermodesulfovibrionales bacterium]|nr:hypothetical protein [Thermodesulfovibrionales bacterium]
MKRGSVFLEWFKDSPEINHIIEETEKICEEYTGRAINFYKAFFQKGNSIVEFIIK